MLQRWVREASERGSLDACIIHGKEVVNEHNEQANMCSIDASIELPNT